MYINPTKDLSARVASKIAAAVTSTQAQMNDSLEHSLTKRQFYGGGYYYGNGTGAWYRYGRWILLGVLVGLALLVYLSVCLCNRRRTRTGQQPVRYTGWATPGYQHPQQSGVIANQPISEPMAPQAYPAQNYSVQNNYSGYQAAPQMSQGYSTAPIAYNDTTLPPQYPASTRPKN